MSEPTINDIKRQIEETTLVQAIDAMVRLSDGTLEIQTFARIPDGWENQLAEHPSDEYIYYWLSDSEWESLSPGDTYADATIVSLPCDECGELHDPEF